MMTLDTSQCQGSEGGGEVEKHHIHCPPTSARATGYEEEDSTPRGISERTLQKWNEPKINMYRFFVTLYSFIIMGMNSGALGALIPYIGPYYDVPYIILSLVFLASLGGYCMASLSNNRIHHAFGQRGVAVIAVSCRLAGYIPIACHPPFPALPILLILPSFGNGLEDSGWNAWMGNMQQANELLGFLHAAWGLGAMIGPLIATSMITKGNLPWYSYYYVMIGLSAIEGSLAVPAFWQANGTVYRQSNKSTTGSDEPRITTRRVLREPITWLIALFLLGYVGVEISLGGWIVSFMLDIRHAEKFAAGITVTGFWLGLTVGRMVLGFFTGRIGEKLAITIYLLICVTLELLYWLVPSFILSAICVAFMGFFLGPLFPAAIVAATKLLPSEFHISAIGFAVAFGGLGAAVFPFAVGAIAQSKGVQILQPIALATFVFILIMWWLLPGGLRRGGLEHARETKESVGHEIRRGYRWARTKRGKSS